MGIEPIFDSANWPPRDSLFWSSQFFVLGCIVGSFLNVVIHRLPLGESVVSPPSHCPHCKYSIPWWLNIPLVTWLWLRGKCSNCRAPIAPRYFLVELLTGCSFLSAWLAFGELSPGVAIVTCVLLAGFIASSFIDFEHMIIPDELTIGGIVAGLFCSFFVPALHEQTNILDAVKASILGAAIGGGLIYAVLRAGKLMFGRQKIPLAPGSQIVLGENGIALPDREIPYEEIFYRRSDTVVIHAQRVEIVDRGYAGAIVRLSPGQLRIDDDTFDPEQVRHLEAVADGIVLPREAMGFGDVKFMAAIGAFLGWRAVIFSLMASSVIGSAVGVTLIVCGKKDWSSRLPYGPYIALGAVIWVFGGKLWIDSFFVP